MKMVRWWYGKNFGLAICIGDRNPIFAFARDSSGVVVFFGNKQFNFGGR